jgi:hypothetical protein
MAGPRLTGPAIGSLPSALATHNRPIIAIFVNMQ